MQKLLAFFQQKILDKFKILTFEILMKPELTTSLVLNNRTQNSMVYYLAKILPGI